MNNIINVICCCSIIRFILFKDVDSISSKKTRSSLNKKTFGLWDCIQIHQPGYYTHTDFLHQGFHWFQGLLHSKRLLCIFNGFIDMVWGWICWHIRTSIFIRRLWNTLTTTLWRILLNPFFTLNIKDKKESTNLILSSNLA